MEKGKRHMRNRIQNIKATLNEGLSRWETPEKPWKKVALTSGALLLIRVLYTLLSVLMLKKYGFPGRYGYDIDFCMWKEALGLPVFVGMTLLFQTLRFQSRFTEIFCYLFLVVYALPMNAVFSLTNQPMTFFLSSHAYLVLFYFLCFLADRFLSRFGRDTEERQLGEAMTSKLFAGFCFVICVCVVIFKLLYNGLSFSVDIGHEYVYATRGDFDEYMQKISGTPLAYLLTILRNLGGKVLPFYLLSCLLRKKYIGMGVALLGTLSMYAISSGKGNLLMIIVVVALFALCKMKLTKYFVPIFTGGVLLLLLVCGLELCIRGTSSLYILFIRRIMYMPSWMNTLYFDYFSGRPPVMWTQETFLLQNVLTPVYDMKPLDIISTVYFAGKVPSPNTGLFAEAIMHFGYWGVLVYPALLAGLISISGWVYRHYGTAMQLLLSSMLVLQITNVSIVRTDFVLSYTAFTACAFLFGPGSKMIRRCFTGRRIKDSRTE